VWRRSTIERARRGDREAITELYHTYAPRLYREVLLPRLGDRAAAEDALSETFRAFLEKLETIEERDGGVWSWLATVATNKANDMFRARQRTGRALASFDDLLAPLRSGQPGSEEQLAAKREQMIVREAIDRVLALLNPRYRQAIELRFLKDESREASAAALGVSTATFDVLLCRALKSFRKEWAIIHGLEAERIAT
jgi:RNA polymerase sigma-70 factor, ECF subfamily